MAMQQLTLPGELVKKDNRLIRSKIHIDNALGARVLASLVACIRTDDTAFEEYYSLPIKDFITDKGGKSYKEIKAVCEELVFAYAEIEYLNQQKLRLIPFVREVIYHNGIVTAQFNANMRELLLQLQRRFTEYNLLEYLRLPSIYSQRIFEILKSWSGLPEVTLSVAELHDMLNTPASFRANFAEFKRRVLEKAHKDITSKTGLRYEWEPIKRGRAVESIRFLFAPGRKAIAEASTQKADQKKQSSLSNKRALTAYNCAKGKDGKCARQDNKPTVCKTCVAMEYCHDILRQRSAGADADGQPTGPRPAGLGVQQVLDGLKA